MRQIAALSLWMGLLAAAAVAAEPPAKAVAYDNVHIRVLDPSKAADWYVTALGANPSEPPAPGTAQVTFGPNVITIIKGETAQPSAGTLIDHIGLVVPRSRRRGEKSGSRRGDRDVTAARKPRDFPVRLHPRPVGCPD